MAKIWLDRLIDKYNLPRDGWSGKPYGELVKKIIAQNSENIQNKIVRMNKTTWDKTLRKVVGIEKRFILPDISSVLPKRDIYVRKASIQGTIISDTLRDSLTKNLKDSLKELTSKTQEPTYIRRRGAMTGTINPKIIKEFEKKITNTFLNYTRKDKTLGMPKNIHTIAVTEVRSSINEVKSQYVKKLVENNPGIEIRKVWIHNKSLSKNPRQGHIQMAYKSAKKPLNLNQEFEVPHYEKGRMKVIKMMYPHDPNAPVEAIVNCNCDIDYRIKRK